VDAGCESGQRVGEPFGMGEDIPCARMRIELEKVLRESR
jgi:hypothetical protein